MPLAVTRFIRGGGTRSARAILAPDDDAARTGRVRARRARRRARRRRAPSCARIADGSKRTYPDPNGYVDYDGYVAIYDARRASRSCTTTTTSAAATCSPRCAGCPTASSRSGSSGWDRWQGGKSISRGADPLIVWLSPDGTRAASRVLPLTDGSPPLQPLRRDGRTDRAHRRARLLRRADDPLRRRRQHRGAHVRTVAGAAGSVTGSGHHRPNSAKSRYGQSGRTHAAVGRFVPRYDASVSLRSWWRGLRNSLRASHLMGRAFALRDQGRLDEEALAACRDAIEAAGPVSAGKDPASLATIVVGARAIERDYVQARNGSIWHGSLSPTRCFCCSRSTERPGVARVKCCFVTNASYASASIAPVGELTADHAIIAQSSWRLTARGPLSPTLSPLRGRGSKRRDAVPRFAGE